MVVTEDLDNRTERPEVTAELERAWAALARDAAAFPEARSHPRVRPWRRAVDAPSPIEALVRRALEGGPPPLVNPLVDFCTTVSVRHVVPVRAIDLNAVDGTVTRATRRARLVAEVVAGLDQQVLAAAVGAHLRVGLRRDLGASSRWWIVSGSEVG